MNAKVFLLFIFLGSGLLCSGQNLPDFSKWDWLLGEWTGEGSGHPGQGSGKFTFTYGLDGKIITRNSHTDFPATADKPATGHDDLMIIYPDPETGKERAVYFDNEGHTIFYSIGYADNEIVMTSDKIPASPVFRLVYTKIDPATVNVRFEMSAHGEKFVPYIEGRSHKAGK